MPRTAKTKINKRVLWIGVPALVVLILLTIVLLDLYYPRPYMAVYLTNGSTYFGELQHFPYLVLKDIYVVQTVVDEENPDQTSFQIIPMKDLAFWAPEELALSRSQIMFISRVSEGSQVMQAINQYKQ